MLFRTRSSLDLPKAIKHVTQSCKAEGCNWRLYATSVKGSELYSIRTFNSEYNYFGINHYCHAQATHAFLTQQLANKLKEQPSYRPIDIVTDIQCEIGV